MTEGITVAALDPTRWSMHPPKLAPGVLGYTHISEGDLWVMLLIGDPAGAGHVGRYLDALVRAKGASQAAADRAWLPSPPERIFVVETMNMVLQGMLERRGFEARRTKMPPPIHEVVDVMAYV